jgi:hypothetical protein
MPPSIDGGADVGSTTVQGSGRPNLAAGCILIFEIGPDNVPYTADDVQIGTAGATGPSGMFTAMLIRPLEDTDVIYAVDTCIDPNLIGPLVLVVSPAPAPALSLPMLLFGIAVLGGVALRALVLRRAAG